MPNDLVTSSPNPAPEPAGERALSRPRSQLPADFADEGEGQGGVGRYFDAVKRYKWLILLITILGTVGGIVGSRFVKPTYTVAATLWLEEEPGKQGPIRAEGLLQADAWVSLLRTGAVLDSVILKERLYLQAKTPSHWPLFTAFTIGTRFAPGDYTLKTDGAGTGYTLANAAIGYEERGRVGDPVGTKVGFQWRPASLPRDAEIAFNVLSPREASSALNRQILATLSRDGRFLKLELRGSDPARITTTLNTVVDQFTQVAAEIKKRKLIELSKILADQVTSVGTQLREAENQLESYKVRTITLPGEGTPIAAGLQGTTPTVMTNYFSQKLQAEELKRDREAIQSVLGRTGTGAHAIDAFYTIPAVRNAPDLQSSLQELSKMEAELRALNYRYTPEARQVQQVQAKIDTLRGVTIPAYAGALASALQAQEAELAGRISRQSRELQSIPARAITEQRLVRDKEGLEGLFNDLQKRYEAAKLAEASATPDLSILDRAVQPQNPDGTTAPMIVGGAFIASMLLAIGLAILLDRLDKRFRYPEQVTHELGLPILGAIPAIRRAETGDRDPAESMQVVEAFRTVRLNIAHSYGAAGPVMLTVTSPSPGDGKSLIASNLALSFAEAGYRTLLVDGDTRRGELHRMFSVERRPGLLDFLADGGRVADIERPTSHRNLTLIPCGTRLHRGPELLGSVGMRDLIATLKARYDAIIVDSPPLGAGIDPFVLGTATGNAVLVLRSGETDRQMAEEKLKLVDRLPMRMLGAVLNDIRAEGVYKYYAYVYGYTAEDESPRLAPTAAEVSEKS